MPLRDRLKSLVRGVLGSPGRDPSSSSGPALASPPSPSAAPPARAAGKVAGEPVAVGRLVLTSAASGLEEGLEVEVPVPGSLLLDVREPAELAGGVAAGALLVPMDVVPHLIHLLPRDRPITVYCAAGARSAGVAHWLREQGFPGAVSLAGGIGALRYGGVEVVTPAGARPGTKVDVPGDADVGGAPLGRGPWRGELVCQEGELMVARVHDAQGLQALARWRP